SSKRQRPGPRRRAAALRAKCGKTPRFASESFQCCGTSPIRFVLGSTDEPAGRSAPATLGPPARLHRFEFACAPPGTRCESTQLYNMGFDASKPSGQPEGRQDLA